jgi:hypothetical protein
METAIFAVTMVLAVAGYLYVQRKVKLEIERRFHEREHLDIERVCDLFVQIGLTDRLMVRELVEHVAGVLSISPSLLRPTDRFEFELKPPHGSEFDSDRNTLLLDLACLAKKRKQPLGTSSIKTLGDYLQAMEKVY